MRDFKEPVTIICSCDDFWSVAQQFAMLQLYARVVEHRPNEINLRRETIRIIPPHPEPDPKWCAPCVKALDGRMVDLTHEIAFKDYFSVLSRYANRALRIAGAYARTYLEDFEQGNPKLVGRFYWAGLAAFASKQVAFTLKHRLVQLCAPFTLNALGKGNLWLYNDALPWHYAWALCPESVRKCAQQRHVTNLHPVVLENLYAQEWAMPAVMFVPCNFDEKTAKSGKPIGYLQWAPLMGKAIDGWDKLAKETSTARRGDLALAHLQDMARHEQGEVLQGLIYDELPFRADLRAMRALDWGFGVSAKYLVFKFQLSFSAEGYVDDPEWRSDAPPGIRVDDYKERMEWIDKAALKYHELMSGKHKQRMLAELRTLADYEG
ncbi:hypothetical protein [Thiomonas sp. FB-6]|uniref:DUF2515 family protein n=1 Tax=Thiomonas sp. FB-6 TaxID=1158291 RepID=UPI001E5BC83F|nr:hypothetical protein [Thiomonas sp. FB-6]